jgi:hypothetical protein
VTLEGSNTFRIKRGNGQPSTNEKGGSPEDSRQKVKSMLNIKQASLPFNIETLIQRGRNEIFTVTLNVDSDIARYLLDRNIDNRPLRWDGAQRSVSAYAAAMLRDEWMLNGEPIIISDEGFLNDGQHRLHAVVKSDTVVPMQITFGVDRESRHTVDQGAARSPGNILSMHGEKNTNKLGHAVQFVWCYDGEKVFGYRPTTDQLLGTLKENPLLRVALNNVNHLCREFRISDGYIAGSYYVCARQYPEKAEEFLDASTTGLNISEKSSPIFRLRKRFQEHASKRETVPALEQAALFIKAFNYFRRNKVTNNLIWRRNGSAAEEFPVVGQ